MNLEGINKNQINIMESIEDEMFKKMEEDVEMCYQFAKRCSIDMNDAAELCAEKYVSVNMGLSDEDDSKKSWKTSYITLFTNKME